MGNTVRQLFISTAGLATLKAHWRQDAIAGFMVFLIALPLCLGVAVASGFPAMAGIISAIIGGILVSRINGTYLTITGPAAGLIVVILNAVQNLGQEDAFAGYRYTLAAICISGVLQIVLGFYKAGRLSAFFPSAVVHGMLAAIGIIIMVKQIPVMVGVKSHATTVLASINELPHALSYFIPQIGLVALLSIVILIAWPQLRQPVLQKIPAPILVIACGILLGHWFDLPNIHPDTDFILPKDLIIGPDFLVTLPDSLFASIVSPDFGKIDHFAFWESVVAITLIGSLETLLSATAIDKLDPENRQANLSRELSAIGVGNLLAGLLGGLPMIAEIVRSSANVDAGARSSWANFFHGLFMLLCVLALPQLLASIPLASLAALLVYTGFRLASPQTFGKMQAIGKQQLLVFLITLISILATNILAGVLLGILAKLLLHVARGVPLNNLFHLSYEIIPLGANRFRVKINDSAVFSNLLALKTQLAELPNGTRIVFDLSDIYLIDHTVMEFIVNFQDDYTQRGGQCEIQGLEKQHASTAHPLAERIKKR